VPGLLDEKTSALKLETVKEETTMRAFIGKRLGYGFFAGVSQRIHMPSFSFGFVLGVAVVLLCAIFFGSRVTH